MALQGAGGALARWFVPQRIRVARLLASSQGQVETNEIQEDLRAELARWNWNWWDGSRASHLRDLDVLVSIVLAIRPLNDKHHEALDQLKTFVAETRVFLKDDSNHRADGRMMPPAAARAFVEVETRLRGSIVRAASGASR